MKKIALTIPLAFLISGIYSQNVGINSTGAAADASALLDVDAAPTNDKGMLLPRIALTAINSPLPVTNPATSLMVYNTANAGVPPNEVIPGFYYWDGTKWVSMSPGVPPGVVVASAGTIAPAGYLLCDGSAISRTAYANLFATIGIMYGLGDGSTTFNLPNYQGYFLRGQNNSSGNDPDTSTRTDRGDGTAGDNVGTKQQDVFGNHRHSPSTGDFDIMGGTGGSLSFPQAAGSGGPYTYTANTNYTNYQGGSETRPKNIYVLYCIKY